MSEMFCFQCEQTAGGKGCMRSGVCGKKASTSNLQDALVGELIALAQNAEAHRTPELDALVEKALFTTLTNVNFDDATIASLIAEVRVVRFAFVQGETYDLLRIWEAQEDIRSLKSLLLFGL